VLAEVDTENRIAAPRHGGVLPIAGTVPGTGGFPPRQSPLQRLGKAKNMAHLTGGHRPIAEELAAFDDFDHLGRNHLFPC
jgi:hypothetical protein